MYVARPTPASSLPSAKGKHLRHTRRLLQLTKPLIEQKQGRSKSARGNRQIQDVRDPPLSARPISIGENTAINVSSAKGKRPRMRYPPLLNHHVS